MIVIQHSSFPGGVLCICIVGQTRMRNRVSGSLPKTNHPWVPSRAFGKTTVRRGLADGRSPFFIFLYTRAMFTLADLGAQFRHTTLSNGTRVVVFERPGMPVYLRACFLSGSRFDDGDQQGTAHFLEHMLVAGTKRFPSKDKLAAYIEQYGGVFGATTSSDALNINVGIGDPADAEKAFEVLHEMLFESLFDEKALETERGSVLGELRDRLSNPGMMVWDVASRLIFQGTVLAQSTVGLRQAIEAMTKDQVVAFFRKNLTAERMLLVVSGGITLETVVAHTERLLAMPASSSKPDMSKSLPVIRAHAIDIERYVGKEQVHLVLGFRTVPAHHPDTFALDIIAQVLGGGRASVLNRELRYQRGLTYSVGAWQRDFADAGMWAIKTSVAKEKVQEVLDVITTVISRVRDQGLTEEEVQFAKSKIMKSQRMELQTSASWVDFHAYQQLLSSESWTLVEYLRGISLVTPEDTKVIAKKYLSPDKGYLALCGDISEDTVRVH